jgi:hypothetical protein
MTIQYEPPTIEEWHTFVDASNARGFDTSLEGMRSGGS